MGTAFQNAVDSSSGHTDSSSTSYGGKVGWCGIGGSVQHTNSDASGAFTSQHDAGQGWSYESSGTGGTLKIFGSQIAGWVGQIQPASPRKDDPNLASPAPTPAATPAATPTPTATPAPTPAPEPVPAPQG